VCAVCNVAIIRTYYFISMFDFSLWLEWLVNHLGHIRLGLASVSDPDASVVPRSRLGRPRPHPWWTITKTIISGIWHRLYLSCPVRTNWKLKYHVDVTMSLMWYPDRYYLAVKGAWNSHLCLLAFPLGCSCKRKCEYFIRSRFHAIDVIVTTLGTAVCRLVWRIIINGF